MGSLPAVAMHSAKGWTHPYQVKRFVGVLEAQQHVLQDGQRSLSHDGIQQLGEDLVGRKKKKQMRRQTGIMTRVRRTQQEREVLSI